MPPSNSQNPTNGNSTTPAVPISDIQVPHKPVPAPIAPSTPLEQIAQANPVPPKVEEVSQGVGGQTPQLSIEEQIAKKEAEMKKRSDDRVAIEEASKKLFSDRHTLEESMAPIREEEKAVIARIEFLEKKKLLAKDPHEARIAETSRWEEEETRRGVEHKKWAVAGQIEALDEKIKEVERQFKVLLAEEDACAGEIKKLRIMQAQANLEKELADVSAERVASEEELARFAKERERLEELLRESVQREADAVSAEHKVEQRHDTVRSVYEEQVLAGERHKLEDARKEAEQKRWEAEDAIPSVTHSLTESQQHLDSIKKKEAEILAKLRALEK